MSTKTLLETRGPGRPFFPVPFTVLIALVVVALATVAVAQASPQPQSKTSHDVAGKENCLMCHPVGGGVKPSPANHSSYSNAMCLGCHPVGAAAAPAPAAPKAEPTAVPKAEPAAPPKAEPTRPAAQGAQPTAAPTPAPAPTQAAPAAPAPAQAAPAQPAAPTCISCHQNKDLSMTLPSGEKLSLFVDEKVIASSVHGGKLACTDCHSRITGFPHKPLQVKDRREYAMLEYEACKRCHFANYTKTLDSIHYKLLEAGNKNAPTCTDCHGSHGVTRPGEPRAKISQSCGTCHRDINDAYSKSVHGAALSNGGAADVPTCTDCHGAHTIRDPQTASFKLNSPEMCAGCHSDAAKMAKYGLSTSVYKTYMQDFHGVTVSLTKRQGPDNWTEKPVCSDCHGVHDIKSTKQGNTEEIRKNVAAICQKCHPDGGANFPDAWMSHYELSLEKTPLPWLVRAFYWVVIPFMLGGLFLHMIVDLWRLARNR